MKNLFVKHRKAFFVILVSMLLLAACGGADSPAEVPTADTVAEAPAAEGGDSGSEGLAPAGESSAAGAGDQCANQYQPVVDGATWVYGGNSFDGPYTWTTSISGVSGSGFTFGNAVASGGDTVLVTHQWACTADGLAALEYGSGPEGSLSATGISADFETVSSSGVSLPRTINVGDSWTQSFTLAGTMTMDEGLSAESSGMATYNYSAVGIETVSVPAGTFEALKVAVDTNIQLQISFAGESGPPFGLSVQSHIWYVEGQGWVQTESTYDFEGFVFSDLIQLQSYTIP